MELKEQVYHVVVRVAVTPSWIHSMELKGVEDCSPGLVEEKLVNGIHSMELKAILSLALALSSPSTRIHSMELKVISLSQHTL